MASEVSKIQTARMLGIFLRHADVKGFIESKNQAFFQELGQLFPNGNTLSQRLYELSEAGYVHYEEVGEDGFAPIVIVGCTSRTAPRLSALLEEIESDLSDLNRRIREILTFDPERLRSDIAAAVAQLQNARSSAQGNDLLRALLGPIAEIDRHLQGVSAVADRYEDIYRNVIRPVQLEGQAGVKATVRWAIIGIVTSTVISIVLGNWKAGVEIVQKLF